MDKKVNLTLFLGTAREGRNSELVFTFFQKLLETDSRVNLNLIDVKDYFVKYDGAKAQKSNPQVKDYDQIISNSNALIFIFPEYNHSFPGQMKSLIDSEFEIYEGKVIGLASVSAGQFGGARALTLLIPVLTYLGMLDSGIHMHFSNIESLFDDQGNILDTKVVERTKKSLEKLINLTQKIHN
jgi:NAD(P)H-dependent FMN reductase